MYNSFKTLGLSFKTAPIKIREQLALGESHTKQLLAFMGDYSSATDVMVLSTCNRTEVYYHHSEDLSATILQGMATIKGLDVTEITPHFVACHDHAQSVNHLFDVAMGLEAQVIGDMQIANQVKNAYQWSADENMAGPFLHRLMHTIFYTNKRVVQETAFRDGAASVSYATKELIEDITLEVPNPRILILGLGEIGRDVCKNLADSKFNNIVITNRTAAKADEMAAECGFEVIDFEEADQAIETADVIVSSIARSEPFITKALVDRFEILSYKFFIDLSVPRSIETSVEEVPGVLLYNIDNIQNKASEALDKRIAAIPDVENIVKEAIADFNDWSKEMIVSPTINKLKNALEEIRKEEIARYLKQATDEEADIIEKATKSMMQKVMKLPVLQLKAACKRGEAETLIDVLNDLFDLEKEITNK